MGSKQMVHSAVTAGSPPLPLWLAPLEVDAAAAAAAFIFFSRAHFTMCVSVLIRATSAVLSATTVSATSRRRLRLLARCANAPLLLAARSRSTRSARTNTATRSIRADSSANLWAWQQVRSAEPRYSRVSEPIDSLLAAIVACALRNFCFVTLSCPQMVRSSASASFRSVVRRSTSAATSCDAATSSVADTGAGAGALCAPTAGAFLLAPPPAEHDVVDGTGRGCAAVRLAGTDSVVEAVAEVVVEAESRLLGVGSDGPRPRPPPPSGVAAALPFAAAERDGDVAVAEIPVGVTVAVEAAVAGAADTGIVAVAVAAVLVLLVAADVGVVVSSGNSKANPWAWSCLTTVGSDPL
jgi:hypothetical protein